MTKLKLFWQRMRDVGWVPLKYLFSSCLAFAIDYVLHLYLDAAIPLAASMEIGAFLAWCVSSITNFFVNRNFVFHSSAPLRVALPEYYSLAVVVHLLKSYVILEILTRALHIPLHFAKPIAEVVLFAGNYLIQKKFIFKKKKAGKETTDEES
ncbi:MAG: GtrA family protein [Clostridia bacterium]|nr:GtrA family protein [Clostridia bacterium]